MTPTPPPRDADKDDRPHFTPSQLAALEAHHASLRKPKECANGCPPRQVCDYCQRAPRDADSVTVPPMDALRQAVRLVEAANAATARALVDYPNIPGIMASKETRAATEAAVSWVRDYGPQALAALATPPAPDALTEEVRTLRDLLAKAGDERQLHYDRAETAEAKLAAYESDALRLAREAVCPVCFKEHAGPCVPWSALPSGAAVQGEACRACAGSGLVSAVMCDGSHDDQPCPECPPLAKSDGREAVDDAMVNRAVDVVLAQTGETRESVDAFALSVLFQTQYAALTAALGATP